jgi:uncharacterized Zn-finger protein
MTLKNQDSKKQPNVSTHYIIRKNELPLSCPTRETEGWNYHPRIYLPIEESKEINCPYCSTKYILEE